MGIISQAIVPAKMVMAPTRKYTVMVPKVVKAVIKRPSKAQLSKTSVQAKVATLAKQVKKLNTISYDKVDLLMTDGSSSLFGASYYQWPITAGLNTWTPIFGSDAADIVNTDKMYVNSYDIRARLQQSSEPDLTRYTMYVVSLKDQGADTSTFDPSTGQLIMTNSVHYRALNNTGMVELNKKFFNIHQKKCFTMGGRTGDQSNPVNRELNFRIVPKQRLIVNPRGQLFGAGVVGIDHPRDPSQNYFFLLFNDNSLIDLESNRIEISGIAHVAIPS